MWRARTSFLMLIDDWSFLLFRLHLISSGLSGFRLSKAYYHLMFFLLILSLNMQNFLTLLLSGLLILSPLFHFWYLSTSMLLSLPSSCSNTLKLGLEAVWNSYQFIEWGRESDIFPVCRFNICALLVEMLIFSWLLHTCLIHQDNQYTQADVWAPTHLHLNVFSNIVNNKTCWFERRLPCAP